MSSYLLGRMKEIGSITKSLGLYNIIIGIGFTVFNCI